MFPQQSFFIGNSNTNTATTFEVTCCDSSSTSSYSSTTSSSTSSSSLSKSKMSQKAKSGMTLLPLTFIPGYHDVICARGKHAKNHVGNRRYRDLVSEMLEQYAQASTKIAKTIIVSTVVDTIREDACQDRSHPAGFVKFVNERWYEVGDHLAREKVGQSFRDSLHTLYKSSTQAKKIRRHAMSKGDDDKATASTRSKKSAVVTRKRKTSPKQAAEQHVGNPVQQMHQQQRSEESQFQPHSSSAPPLTNSTTNQGNDAPSNNMQFVNTMPTPNEMLLSTLWAQSSTAASASDFMMSGKPHKQQQQQNQDASAAWMTVDEEMAQPVPLISSISDEQFLLGDLASLEKAGIAAV